MKKFLIKISYTVFPIWFFFIFVTIYLYKVLDSHPEGDLGKLSFIPHGYKYEKMLNTKTFPDTLFQTITEPEQLKNMHIEVLTVGDSFSRQGNRGYQNSLSEKGCHIVNLDCEINPIQTAYNLMSQKYIDSSNVEVLIIESVERYIIERMKSLNLNNPYLSNYNTDEKTQTTWSLQRARNYILSSLGYHSSVLNCKLNKSLFTTAESKSLYFYFEDIKNETSIEEGDIQKIKTTYDALVQKANEMHIKLIFMIAVDKYDLYQDFIVENPYPQKAINEDIKKILGKDTIECVFSKDYLLPHLKNGERDIFMYHDTHWSYKGARIVADEIYKRI